MGFALPPISSDHPNGPKRKDTSLKSLEAKLFGKQKTQQQQQTGQQKKSTKKVKPNGAMKHIFQKVQQEYMPSTQTKRSKTPVLTQHTIQPEKTNRSKTPSYKTSRTYNYLKIADDDANNDIPQRPPDTPTRIKELPENIKWQLKNFPQQQPTDRKQAEMVDQWLEEHLNELEGIIRQELTMANRSTISDVHPKMETPLNDLPPERRSFYYQKYIHLYSTCMHEIIRQVSCACAERGRLISKVWLRFFDLLLHLKTRSQKDTNFHNSMISRIADMTRARKAHYKRRIAEEKQQFQDLSHQKQHMEGEMQTLSSSVEHLQQEKMSLQSHIDQLREDLKNKQDTISRREASMMKMESHMRDFLQEEEGMQQELYKLRKKLKSIGAYEKQIEELQDLSATMKTQLEELNAYKKKNEEEKKINTEMRKLEELKMKELQQKDAFYRRETQQYKKRITSLHEKWEEEKQRVDKLSEELSFSKRSHESDVEDMANKLKEQENTIKHLRTIAQKYQEFKEQKTDISHTPVAVVETQSMGTQTVDPNDATSTFAEKAYVYHPMSQLGSIYHEDGHNHQLLVQNVIVPDQQMEEETVVQPSILKTPSKGSSQATSFNKKTESPQTPQTPQSTGTPRHFIKSNALQVSIKENNPTMVHLVQSLPSNSETKKTSPMMSLQAPPPFWPHFKKPLLYAYKPNINSLNWTQRIIWGIFLEKVEHDYVDLKESKRRTDIHTFVYQHFLRLYNGQSATAEKRLFDLFASCIEHQESPDVYTFMQMIQITGKALHMDAVNLFLESLDMLQKRQEKSPSFVFSLSQRALSLPVAKELIRLHFDFLEPHNLDKLVVKIDQIYFAMDNSQDNKDTYQIQSDHFFKLMLFEWEKFATHVFDRIALLVHHHDRYVFEEEEQLPEKHITFNDIAFATHPNKHKMVQTSSNVFSKFKSRIYFLSPILHVTRKELMEMWNKYCDELANTTKENVASFIKIFRYYWGLLCGSVDIQTLQLKIQELEDKMLQLHENTFQRTKPKNTSLHKGTIDPKSLLYSDSYGMTPSSTQSTGKGHGTTYFGKNIVIIPHVTSKK